MKYRESIRMVAVEMLDESIGLEAAEAEFRRTYMAVALARVNNNQSKAASVLGVHRNTVVRTIRTASRKRQPRSMTPPLFRKVA